MSREKWSFLFRQWVVLSLVFLCWGNVCTQTRGRVRDFGIEIGILPPGKWNAITDVEGVLVGHTTLIRGDSVRTGVTAVLPHGGNVFQNKVPGAVYVGDGFGKLTGSTQVEELGEIETPVVLTNTLSVSTAVRAVVEYVLGLEENEHVRSVNAVVGETNDGWLNDIRGFHVREEDVWQAIRQADSGIVEEGCVGAGTGTRCLGFKGGIGTASRKLPPDLGGWTVGVLVQTNFSGILRVNGAPVGRELNVYRLKGRIPSQEQGSCMIVVATDAPLLSRNLKRLASNAIFGLVRCGGYCYYGSGDYVIAFSTHPGCRIKRRSDEAVLSAEELRNERVSPLFLAALEATEEAILNSIFQATTMVGRDGRKVEALPIPRVIEICKKYNVLNWGRTLPPGRRN